MVDFLFLYSNDVDEENDDGDDDGGCDFDFIMPIRRMMMIDR